MKLQNIMQPRLCRLDEIIDLRNEVLIRGTDRVSPYFEGDYDENTLHVGLIAENKVVGCLSFMRNVWEGNPAWQLRGMAIDPTWRGKGAGRILLDYAETVLMEKSDIRQLWCNARANAVGFYEKMGWQVVSEEFTIPHVGPHYKMIKIIKKS